MIYFLLDSVKNMKVVTNYATLLYIIPGSLANPDFIVDL